MKTLAAEIKKYLWLGQGSLIGLLVICCLIMPSVVIKNGGVSNFGNHPSTIVFYTAGFVLNIVFVFLAAQTLLRTKHFNKLAYVLILYCGLVFLTLISTFPRHLSFTYSDIHDYLGVALFSLEFILSVWIAAKHTSSASVSYLVIEAIGSLIGLLSILKVIHFLFIGQFIGTIGFSLLFVLIFPEVIDKELAKATKHTKLET